MTYRTLTIIFALAGIAAFAVGRGFHGKVKQAAVELDNTLGTLAQAQNEADLASSKLRSLIERYGDLPEYDELNKLFNKKHMECQDESEELRNAKDKCNELERDVRGLEETLRRLSRSIQAKAQSGFTSDSELDAPTSDSSATDYIGMQQGGDRSGLDPLIANMRALRCREAASQLYQKRLLTLLPLIRNGADVNITLQETKGNTALHYACGIGSWSITQWLVEHGADVNAVTNAGKTPLDCVGADNAKRIRELLISRGAKRSSELTTNSGTYSTEGDADELNNLGLAYQYGNNGKPQNYNEAARYFRLAAEQGHAGAQNNLGFCYHNGWGVPKDMSQAAVWYKRSAEQGNAWGQSNYGTCLEFGWGVRKNVSAAIEMYRRAAAQGHASAKKHLKRHGITM